MIVFRLGVLFRPDTLVFFDAVFLPSFCVADIDSLLFSNVTHSASDRRMTFLLGPVGGIAGSGAPTKSETLSFCSLLRTSPGYLRFMRPCLSSVRLYYVAGKASYLDSSL